jgi:flavin-dependent dehydrogenase
MTFDAIVIGGGPAGSTAALSLLRKGWSVAIVEKASFPRRKVCGEFMSATSTAVIDSIGLGDTWRARAGPEVRRLALFSGATVVDAPMPVGSSGGFGRALGRDVLDALMIDLARKQGAAIFQPGRALAVAPDGDQSSVRIAIGDTETTLVAPVIIAAHGSWEQGPLRTHLEKINRPGDFLGFKAYFRHARLPSDLMPLLFFPGGYGGIVWADDGRLSVSCCIRRDALARARQVHAESSASEAVHRHIMATCLGVRQVIGKAEREGPWLAAGPIRPGIRAAYASDVFRVGNVAGESHPIIAEGISMAIQSGWLLADELLRVDARDPSGRARAGRFYGSAWRSQFAMRIHVATALAAVAVRPGTARLAGLLVKVAPAILTVGASLSGKTKTIRALG